MLLRRDGEDVLAIGQPAHAWLSGQLARAWGNETFGAVEPWEEVCLGAEQHDVGMTAWEQAPTLNPETGLPRSFMELTLDEHLPMWSAAAGLVVPQSRYAALLVSLHGTTLYERRDLSRLPPEDADRIRAFMADQNVLQHTLSASLHADPAQVRRNQRLVWTWDSLSLGLLLAWAPYEIEHVPTADGDTTLALRDETLDPWPFRTPHVALRCEGRRLTGRFGDEETMRAALNAAPWETIEIALSEDLEPDRAEQRERLGVAPPQPGRAPRAARGQPGLGRAQAIVAMAQIGPDGPSVDRHGTVPW
jgi:hypothetical protein